MLCSVAQLSFVVLSCVIGAAALDHVMSKHDVSDTLSLLALSIPSCVIFSVLAVAKMCVGVAVDSPSLRKDAFCSGCGALLALGVIAGIAVNHTDARIWYVDASVALALSAVLNVLGLYTLAKNARLGNSWWRPSWWLAPSSGVNAMKKGGAPHGDLFMSPGAKRGGDVRIELGLATTPSTASSPSSDTSPVGGGSAPCDAAHV